MHKLFVILSFFISVNQTIKAQDQGNLVPGNNIADTILYKHDISIALDSVDAWKAEKKFAWAKNLDSLLKEKEHEFMNDGDYKSNHSSSFLQNFFSLTIVRFLLWAVVVIVVLFIIYRLFISKGIFRRTSSTSSLKSLEDIQQQVENASDYDALIRQSFNRADYRMAIRYQFLKTLHLLTDKGLLQHSTDKTNFQYVQEIAMDKRKDFSSLVLNYEYVWYGHLNIAREQYEQMEKKYIAFYNKI